MGTFDGDRYEVSADDFAALAGALARIRKRNGDASSALGSTANRDHARSLIKLATALHRARRRRDALARDLFGEPAYDMLLDLFVAHGEGRMISVSSAAIASGVPGTTALRHIEALATRGLIARRPDEDDGRRCHLLLTDAGLDLMTQHLTDLERSLP
jgi:DNA-binding MarR family transcriptional regulator